MAATTIRGRSVRVARSGVAVVGGCTNGSVAISEKNFLPAWCGNIADVDVVIAVGVEGGNKRRSRGSKREVRRQARDPRSDSACSV
jgi:hypothetical protein